MLVDFYHLTMSPIERVLPRICEKLLAANERLLVVAEPGLLEQLDGQLWSHPRDSFLPHGRHDGPEPGEQPVLLSPEPDALNGAQNIALADGRWRDEALTFARAFYFFDSAHIEEARQSWRALKDKPEAECRYWKQVEGKWVQGP